MQNQASLITKALPQSQVKLVLFLMVLILITFLPLLLNIDLPELSHQAYLPLHTVLEILAIVIAAMIFAIIREQALVNMTLRGVVLACSFFTIFWLDLAHLLSYQGMPDYFTVNEPQKTINFWLAARLIAALALCFAVLPVADRSTGLTTYYKILLAAIATVISLNYWFVNHPNTLPVFYVDGVGLTKAKIIAEYVVIFINLITVFFILHYRRHQRPFHTPALFAAVVTMILSEFYFTLYGKFSDSFNILGHVLKLLSYLFLYRALVFETLAAPFAQMLQSKAELSATLAAVPDILFDVDL